MAFNLDDIEIKKASKVAAPRSALIYGPPKNGKSVLAASIIDVPGFDRVLVVDVEGGASAISVWYPEVDIVQANTAELFTGIVESLIDGTLVEPESGLPYQVVIIDTLDKAQERQLAVYAASRESKTKNGEDNPLYKFGAILTWMNKVVDALHQAPFLTIFLLHQQDDKNEETGKVTTTVFLQGAAKYTIAGTPDLIGHLSLQKVKGENGTEVKRVLDFSLDDRKITGQRYASALNGVMPDPTFEKVYQKIIPELFTTTKKN